MRERNVSNVPNDLGRFHGTAKVLERHGIREFVNFVGYLASEIKLSLCLEVLTRGITGSKSKVDFSAELLFLCDTFNSSPLRTTQRAGFPPTFGR